MTSNATKVGMMPAPEGVTPDFSGDRTELQSRIIVVYSTMTALSTFVLGLRLYTRICIRGMTGLDDLLIVLSWLGCVAWLAICFYAFPFGFGEHLWNVTLEQMLDYKKVLVGIMTVYVWTPALTKLSLLALFHRLNPDNKVRACIYALALLVFGYSLAITIVATGPCNPQTHTDQKCLTDLNLFMAIINILTDFFILCLPIPMLRALQLPTKQRVLLGMVFALGSGVIVISTVRIIYVYNLISNPDATYNQAAACIFSSVELNGGVICACIALLKPFLQQHMPWLLSFSSQSRSRSGSGMLGIFGKRSDGKSYELRSGDADAVKKNDGGQIAVTTTYSVQGKTRKTIGDSTEDLFVPGLKSWSGAN
ncbi:Nn.00g016400.m01.CDS01 [Neocucurbitaria sp. VM-36]